MQEMTTSVCDSRTTPSSTSSTYPEKFLTDLRGGGGHLIANGSSATDGYTYSETTTGKYRIRKMADGNCWMTENLDLPFGSSTTFYSYDSNITAVPDSTTTEDGKYGTYTNVDGIISWTPKNVVDTATCTSGAEDCSPDYISSAGHIDNNVLNSHNYYGNGSAGNRYDNHTNQVTIGANTYPMETQGIGTYYNWAAAVAQSGTASESATYPIEADNSICPKGWRLPVSGTTVDKSWAKLLDSTATATDLTYGDDTTGSTNARAFPISLAFIGRYNFYTGHLGNQGNLGFWFMNTAPGALADYSIFIDISTLRRNNSGNGRAYANSVRCVSL